MFQRLLKIKVPRTQSLFLWGARQTGKSDYLEARFPEALRFDLLDTELLLRYTNEPYLFRKELLSYFSDHPLSTVIVDEIQKVPLLLNEIHWLITKKKIQFILCGSSTRKLKTSSANLLGGRAWVYHFYPLVYSEIPNFDLLRALQHGLLPEHYLSEPEFIRQHLQSYVNAYLTDEIRHEGLVRNLAHFSRFLEIAGISNGELINMNNIARDSGVSRNTVEGYFQILVDTLLGYYVYPYRKKVKRDIITMTPKFYLFDVGIANYIGRRVLIDLKGEAAGKSFEHYIFMEIQAYRGLNQKNFDIHYWRTKTGLEVDCILGNAAVAIEIKLSVRVHAEELKGLQIFCAEHPKTKAICVSQDAAPREMEVDKRVIYVMPWRLFLEKLWRGEII